MVAGLFLLKWDVGYNLNYLVPDDLVIIDQEPLIVAEEVLWEENVIDTIDLPNCTEIRKIMFWTGQDGNKEMIKYYICEEDVIESRKVRSSGHYLDDLYEGMYMHDKQFLDALIEGYGYKIEAEHLNRLDAARMVVRSIQSIPYTLVHSHDHERAEKGLPHRVEYHKEARSKYGQHIDRIGGCLQSINESGVVSPLEFASHHMGDCDSRTMFLYTIMSELGFDVVILGSQIERHSILGISINLDRHREDFYLQNGTTKYYVWETTNTGFDLGMYPGWDQQKWTIDLN